MKFTVIFLSIFLLGADSGFKQNQLKYKRVRDAYTEKENEILEKLSSLDIDISTMNVYIRIFKKEKLVELWAQNSPGDSFKLVEEYDICRLSGWLGPKRREGDLQVPEGYYHINVFNPFSSYHLSMCINYPNKSDKVLSDKEHPGGDICIHGNCVTIGCVPITDDKIKELYIYCVEAKNNGQQKVPVTFFPCKLSDISMSVLKEKYKKMPDFIDLWDDLKEGYDYFNEHRKLPRIRFNADGSHDII